MPATASSSTTRAPSAARPASPARSTARARIKFGLQEHLYLGNLDAKRDWGHARGYVRMQWLMLQQDHPEDYVIATGQQHSVRDFVQRAACEIGIEIRWEASGVDEKGYAIAPFDPDASWGLGREERCIVAVDPRYFRPTEVETLLGDASKARRQLGWEPEISFAQLVAETMCADLKDAKRDALVRGEGYPHSERSESKRGRAPAIRRN
jgi:GDPmannose 4,6-dehydratase